MNSNRWARPSSLRYAHGGDVRRGDARPVPILRAVLALLLVSAVFAPLLAASVPVPALARPRGDRRSHWWVRPTYNCRGVHIRPGVDIQAKIDAHGEGTTFCIDQGVYRLVTGLIPKSGDRFIGQGRAVISGARVLNSFTRSGSYWVATGQTQESTPFGSCINGYTGCQYNEDVYMGNVPLWQVTSLSQLAHGKFYFDYGADSIYLADDPAGHRVEATIARKAFWGGPRGVRVKGLRIEKFSNPAQDTCVGGWPYGLVEGNEVRFCHGTGVSASSHELVKNNWIHDMGQMGVCAPDATGAVFEKNEIAYNNTMGFGTGWEAGGSKFAGTTGLIVTGNYVHNNVGSGLWTDGNNIHTLYADNIVERNSTDGIVHEISYGAMIRNNVIRGNGAAPGPAYGAGILVAASPNVTIRANTLKGNRASILLLAQDRGSGAYGPHILRNNLVLHNTVRGPMDNGLRLDGVSDVSYYTSLGNRFQYNTYYVRAGSPPSFYWRSKHLGRKPWVGYGQDTKGSFFRSR